MIDSDNRATIAVEGLENSGVSVFAALQDAEREVLVDRLAAALDAVAG